MTHSIKTQGHSEQSRTMKNFFYKKGSTRTLSSKVSGFTLLEIIVVVAILGIILLTVLPQFSKSRETQVLNSAVGDVLSSLNQARAQTLASLDSSSYGVHFQADKVIIFKGAVFSAEDPDNQAVAILEPAMIEDVTLNGVGGSSGELYFARISGSPSKSGTVTLATPNAFRIITISATGGVSAD